MSVLVSISSRAKSEKDLLELFQKLNETDLKLILSSFTSLNLIRRVKTPSKTVFVLTEFGTGFLEKYKKAKQDFSIT